MAHSLLLMPLPDILQKREKEILLWLARDWTYQQIATHAGIRLPTLHVHMHHIRQKTGIKNTRNPDECKAYVRVAQHTPATPYQRPLSWTQKEVLSMIAEGLSYAEIGKTLNMGSQTAQNHASEACQRLHINGRGSHARTAAIKAWVAQQNGTTSPMADPGL